MNVEQRIRKRRRDAELAAAFGDIERDLDDLRSTLGRALADYESRLDDILDDLPAWLNFDRDEVEAFFTTELGEGPVRIGPRAAAVAAAAVESYLHAWVDPESANFPPDVDDSLGSQWAAQLEEADDRLAEVESAVRDTTTTAERELGARLDELLGELEDNREQGEADLREKIASGEVEAGPEARKIEAKLWERQRDRAAELREAWEPLEQIAFEGAELSVELLASLRDFLERSVDALVDAHPELRSFAGDWAKPTGQRIWRIERPQPMPRQRDPHSPSFQVDDARRITEPLDPTETYEYGRDVEPPVHDTSPPRYASPTPAPLAPSTVIDAAVTRIVQGWHPVTRGEFLLMVGPPAVYFGFLAVTAAMFRLGYSPENPFDRWNWAFPVFLGLAVYSFVMPAFMRWRVQWNGLRPQLVRWEEERQDAYVRVDGKGVSLGPTRLEFDGCRVKLQRVRAGGRFSWLFTMRVGRIELTLIADANETRWASGSAEVIDNVPPRAWKLSEETLLAIAQRAGKQP